VQPMMPPPVLSETRAFSLVMVLHRESDELVVLVFRGLRRTYNDDVLSLLRPRHTVSGYCYLFCVEGYPLMLMGLMEEGTVEVSHARRLAQMMLL
jgi:hypothetical protein